MAKSTELLMDQLKQGLGDITSTVPSVKDKMMEERVVKPREDHKLEIKKEERPKSSVPDINEFVKGIVSKKAGSIDEKISSDLNTKFKKAK